VCIVYKRQLCHNNFERHYIIILKNMLLYNDIFRFESLIEYFLSIKDKIVSRETHFNVTHVTKLYWV
jgi:hypothetical protein